MRAGQVEHAAVVRPVPAHTAPRVEQVLRARPAAIADDALGVGRRAGREAVRVPERDDLAGAAPNASKKLAVVGITTKLVILWINGWI